MSTSDRAPIERHDSNRLFNQVVAHGDTVYLAGQIAQDGASVAEQTRTVLRQIDERLALAGSDKARVLSATIFLKDISTFGEFNEEWKAWVDPQALPVRATVEASLAFPEVLVEICVIAAR